MYSTTALVLLGMLWTVNSEVHSLYYIYTALSKPLNLPSVHEFTAMGLLDDKMIDYYDSVDRKKVPKQPWMEERMEPDYWTKGTHSRKSKEQWFKVNVDILMDRMRQNSSDVHILQWRHGCTVEQGKDKSVRFISGIDQYSYDGDDFLSFDDSNMRWIAPSPQAQPTKLKWDNVPILNQYTKGYLEKECVDWLKRFSEYGEAQIRKSSPPTVYSFAKRSKRAGHLVLTCMATGFIPKSVTLEIRKNNIAVTEDTVTSTGVLPNNDDTYQIRKSTEISDDSNEEYDCYVNHEALPKPVIQKWDKKCMDCPKSIALAAGIAIALTLVIVAVILLILFKMKKIVIPGCEAKPAANCMNGLGEVAVECSPLNENGSLVSNTALSGSEVTVSLLPVAPQLPKGDEAIQPLMTDTEKNEGDGTGDSGQGTDGSSTGSRSSDDLKSSI